MLNLLLLQMAAWVVVIGAGAGGVSLIVRTWLRNRHELTAADVRRLMATVDEIHHSLEDLRAEGETFRRQIEERVGDISGRIEFAERLLTKGETPQR